MYVVKIVGAIRGIEQDMEFEVQNAVKKALENTFENHGLFEILVIETTEHLTGLEVK